MSMNGISNTFIPNTLSGLESLNATNITINGVDISTLYVPFVNSPSDVDLSDKNLTTTGRVQTTILKLPSVSYSTTKVLRVNASKEVESVDLATVYVPYSNATNDLDMGGYRVYSLSAPLVANELVNKQYVDSNFPNYTYVQLNYLSIATAQSDYVPYNYATNNITLGSYTVYTNKVPTAGGEVVNKTYVDTTFPTFGFVSSTYAPIANPTFTGTVSGITKSMVGLGNVDNTSDLNKPISTATQTALNLKADLASPTFTGTVSGITKAMVGLGNVDNTSDANKPVSTATQTALNLKADLASPTFTGTVSGITSAMVGLGNVDNTSDLNKPVSTATQTALNLKANLASPTLTGVPLAPTASAGTNTTQIATTAFVTAAIGAGGVTSFSAGSTGFTPNTATTGAIVLAGTLNVANGGTGVTTSTGSTSVVLSASPTLTGVPLAPTASAGTNTTQIATTAFVTTAVSAVGIPTQINATAINTSVSLYPAWFQSIAGGSSTVYVESDGSLFYNPSTNRLTVPIVSATSVVETATVQNSSGQTVTINAQGGAIAGNRINLQIQSTNYYYFDKDAFYLTQPVNNVISSVTNDLYLLWPSTKLLSFNNWATFDSTGFYMASTRKIQAQTFETQPSQNLTLNVPTATNLINFNFNGNTRACVTDYGFWLPVDGSRSIYMTDTAPYGATTTYGRFFGVSGAIYQDFYNQFTWRRDSGLTGAGVADLMSLNSNGLTLQNATALGQPQLTFAGSGIPTIKANGNGINWSINGGNSGYFDMNAWSAGYGWRINANQFMTMQCAYDMVIQCKVGGVPQSGANNRYIQIVTPNSVNSVNDIGGNGWYSGACVFRAQEYNGNLGGGIGISMSSYPAYGGNNWGYVTCVEPGTAWRNWAFGGSTCQWYVNGTMCAYINSTAGWIPASDARVKRDIQDLNTKKSLQRVLKCKPKHYKRILREPKGDNPIPLKQEDIDRVHIGLLAQEVLEYNPHCVSTWEDDDDKGGKVERLGLAYQDFIIHLIGSVQEQQKQIDTQQAKIEEQSQAINTLTESMKTLTDHLSKLTMAFNEMKK